MTGHHIMVDIETAGPEPGRDRILTLGAVRFNPTANDLSGVDPSRLPDDQAFYRRISLKSCVALGLCGAEDIHKDTLAWWDQQDPAIRHEAFQGHPRYGLAEVVGDFVQFCGSEPILWAHPPVFDLAFLELALKRLNITPPWHWGACRDSRTLCRNAGRKVPWDARYRHHALYDACAQAVAVQVCHEDMGKGRKVA